jgi:thioredoxin reductase
MAAGADELHGIIIVGGGTCGLATALALHRYAASFFGCNTDGKELRT